MDNRKLISIVIPVFNGDHFLSYAVESVLGQTYSDWELTIVNDGSTDDTPHICDSFAESDKRICVIHQSNEGVNSARARGVENSHGEYIMFLDADDELLPGAIESFLTALESGVKVLAYGKVGCKMSREDYIESLLKGEIGPELWGKFFEMNLFKRIDYHLERRIAMGEDLLLNLMLALEVSQIKLISNPVYVANAGNSDSVTKTFKKTWEYEKYYFKRVEELFLKKSKELTNFDEIIYLVNKSRVNGMKYVILDGNSINFSEPEYLKVKAFFHNRKKCLGPSERILFIIESSFCYRTIMRVYFGLRKMIKHCV